MSVRQLSLSTYIVRIAICLAVGALVSVLLGQDANWDLRNYHIQDPYAVFAGRLGIDLDPASLQSYFNPTLDMPYYLLATGPLNSRPRLLAALMGLPYGGLIFVASILAERLFRNFEPMCRAVLVVAGTAAAVTGAASLCQAGTTFNEVTVSALVLGGFVLALPPSPSLAEGGLRRLLAAGFLFGLAAGLKLTALIYAPAFCLALLMVTRGLSWFGLAATFSTGWTVGFAVPAGWWGWQLFRQFGNPFFPLFNGVFRSAWFPPMSFYDSNFLPRTALQWAFYPFWWLTWRDRAVNAELAYRDPRLAAFLVCLVLIAGVGCLTWIVRRRAPPAWTQEQRFVLWFSGIGYALWLYSSAIMRYGVVLEVVGTLICLMVLARIARAIGGPSGQWTSVGAVVVASLVCIVWTRPPDYGRIPYGPKVFDIDMGWTPAHTLFIAITGPTAYLTAFVPAATKARVIGFSYLNRLAEDWPLTTRSAELVRAHNGPIFVLVPEDDGSMVQYLPLLGLAPVLEACREIVSNLDHDSTRACEAHRLPQ